MGICGSSPAVKQSDKPALGQNGHTAPALPKDEPEQKSQLIIEPRLDVPVREPFADERPPLASVENRLPLLSPEPILQAVAPVQRVSVTAPAPLLSQAPPGVRSLCPADLPYAAPFIPPPSLPPPEYSHQDAAMPFQPLRKKAVLIGCNYTSIPEAALKGCVKDANCLCQLLTAHYGFEDDNIILLHDQQPHAEYLPTKANILAAIAWLVRDCEASDSLFFSFSGHGCQPPHQGGGSWDEGILPSDFQQAGPLTDDQLHTAMVRPLRHGVRLHAVIDACQSCPSLNLRCTARARRDGWSEWQDGAHGHQRQRQVQLPPDVLLQGGVAPELAEPDSASFASGAGEAVLLTSTGDDDVIDAQATMHLPSTGMDQ
ncbi:hypothetical protein ABBQ32_001316 [Trebouxia sp. C0010 RCD-2024]